MGDFKSEIEEQKKVHLCVDMTNISPPSEKNIPLPQDKTLKLANQPLRFFRLNLIENGNLVLKATPKISLEIISLL